LACKPCENISSCKDVFIWQFIGQAYSPSHANVFSLKDFFAVLVHCLSYLVNLVVADSVHEEVEDGEGAQKAHAEKTNGLELILYRTSMNYRA
jgi:hypothetical protein